MNNLQSVICSCCTEPYPLPCRLITTFSADVAVPVCVYALCLLSFSSYMTAEQKHGFAPKHQQHSMLAGLHHQVQMVAVP